MPPRFLTVEEVQNVINGGERGYITAQAPPTNYPMPVSVPIAPRGTIPAGYVPTTSGLPGLPGGLPVATNPLTRPGVPINPIDLGGLGGTVGAIGGAACGMITNAVARAACVAAVGAGTDYLANKAGSVGTTAGGCPPGSKPDAQGRCMKDTILGTIQRTLPGGQSGYVWDPVMGFGGIPAVTPVAVQRVTRACPGGFVLGRDGLCYLKGTLPRQLRQHPPGPRPLLSAADGKILNRAKSVAKKLQRVAGKHVKKPCRCSVKRVGAKK